MSTISIQDAQSNLAGLIHSLSPGDELVITENDKPVARLISTSQPKERKLGTLKGTVLAIAADFDAPLDDFKDYMQ